MTLKRLLWTKLKCLCLNECQFDGGFHIARGALATAGCAAARQNAGNPLA